MITSSGAHVFLRDLEESLDEVSTEMTSLVGSSRLKR